MSSVMKATSTGVPATPTTTAAASCADCCSHVESTTTRICQTSMSIRQGGTIAGVAMAVTAMSLLCTTEESYSSFLQCVLICWIVVLVYYNWFEAPSSTNKNSSGTGSEVDCADGATWSNGGGDTKGGEWIGRAWPIVVVVASASNAIIMCRTEVGQVRLLVGLALLAVVSLCLSVYPGPRRCLMCGTSQRCEEMGTAPETDLQGGKIKFGGPRSFYNEKFGFGLRVQESSLRPDTEDIHPVKLCHTSKAVVCDGDYMFVTRTAVFGPKGATFDEPLLLCMEVREDETPVYTKGDGIWHKCEESDVCEVYPCHRRGVRHFLVYVKHFCSYGVATHPIRCRDISNRRFWSMGTHRFFTPRKIQVSESSPPRPGVDGKLLCIVVPLEWVKVQLTAVGANVNVPGGGGVGLAAQGHPLAASMSERQRSLFPSAILQPGDVWETHIPKQMGHSVGLVLARVNMNETATTVTTFTQFFVEVGHHVKVHLSNVSTDSSPYPTIDADTQALVWVALKAAGIRAPAPIANPANATCNFDRSSSHKSTWNHLAVWAGAIVTSIAVGAAAASNL